MSAPAPALVTLLRSRGVLLPRIVGAASREVEQLLPAPFGARHLIRRGSGFRWRAALLYRQAYDAQGLLEELRRVAPDVFGALTLVVTDVALEPPPEWRYLVFRTYRREAIVSLSPLDPRCWGEGGGDRTRRLKVRLRAAMVAALAPLVGAPRCEEPGCFFDRTVDGVDALDAMEEVGRRHPAHPAAGMTFRAVSRPLGPDRLVPGQRLSSLPKAFDRRPAHALPVEVGWEAGPTAALDLFAVEPPDAAGRVRLLRRHVTPWSPTVRAPVERIVVPLAALAEVRDALDLALGAPRPRGVNLDLPPPAPLEALRRAGTRLHDLFFPPALERALTRRGVFLELGIDERLLDVPFELMHDAHGFLALRHFVGRFVNAGTTFRGIHPGPIEPDQPHRGRALAPLRALVVGAASCRFAGLPALPQAESEAAGVATLLTRLGARVTLLRGESATHDAVYEALRAGPHLVHYAGHAEMDAKDPARRRLLLHDRPLDAETWTRVAGRRPPAILVLNACEAGRTDAGLGAGRRQGLIDSLLVVGTYVLAARWAVADASAAAFAEAFYRELLEAGTSLGVAVTRAREAARRAARPEDLTWATYVLYGDPRLALTRR